MLEPGHETDSMLKKRLAERKQSQLIQKRSDREDPPQIVMLAAFLQHLERCLEASLIQLLITIMTSSTAKLTRIRAELVT
jgi:hypothetical protein